MGVKYPALVLAGLLGLAIAARFLARAFSRSRPGRTAAHSDCPGRRDRAGRSGPTPRPLAHVVVFAAVAWLSAAAGISARTSTRAIRSTRSSAQAFGGAGLDEVLDPIKRPMAVDALEPADGARAVDARARSVRQLLAPVRAGLPAVPAGAAAGSGRRGACWALAAIGYAFLTLCLTQRQSMRFVLIAVGPMSVAVAWLARTWWDAATVARHALVVGAAAGARIRGEPGRRAGAARARAWCSGASRPSHYLARREPTYPRRPVGRRAPARVGPPGRAGPPRLLHPARLHDGAGPPPTDRPGPPRRVGRRGRRPTPRRPGFTHVLLCPPVPETAVEFDPTLGRLLAPWLAGAGTALPRRPDRRRRRRPALRDLRPADDRLAGRREGRADDRRGPTLAELRARVQKDRHREIGNWLARRVGAAVGGLRHVAGGRGWGSRRTRSRSPRWPSASRRPWRSARARGSGSSSGVALAHLAFWLDHVDGQVARWRGTASLDGVYFDYLMHHAANLTLGFALGYGLAARIGRPALGGRGLRDRARLGRSEPAQRLPLQGLLPAAEARDADLSRRRRQRRPARAARRPGRGGACAALTWPAYKACEPHVVLIGLTGLAVLAMLAPAAWLALWRVGRAAAWPRLLPCSPWHARRARSNRGATETEFARWFQPIDDDARRE